MAVLVWRSLVSAATNRQTEKPLEDAFGVAPATAVGGSCIGKIGFYDADGQKKNMAARVESHIGIDHLCTCKKVIVHVLKYVPAAKIPRQK